MQNILKNNKKLIGILRYKLSQCSCKNLQEKIEDPSIIKEVILSTSRNQKLMISPSNETTIFHKTQIEPTMLEKSAFLDYLVAKNYDSIDKLSLK